VITIPRRRFALGLCALPLSGLACGGRPETPLAHLYGPAWVSGAYEQYATTYHGLQSDAEQQSFVSYRLLAQKGITALDGLQLREVPFHILVSDVGDRFGILRDVPERLTFTADMSEADREAATAGWKKAQEHIHTDYEECKRLEWALTRLLGQLGRIRAAIDTTQDEQFKLTRQVLEVHAGTLPFELPYQVSKKDYELVLVLLIERLDDDKKRLEAIESAVVTVGLTARSTDARSASLASNLRKVLLAVVKDAAASEPRPAQFPTTPADRERLEASGRRLIASILKSPEYDAWQKRERDKALEQVGAILGILDQVTHLPASKVFKTFLTLWRGTDDYLEYLKLAASFVPSGTGLSKTLEQATSLTDKVRKAKDVADSVSKGNAPQALVNTATAYARKRIDKQLVFFQDKAEASEVAEALGQTPLMSAGAPTGR
jgi:hypothetical protein